MNKLVLWQVSYESSPKVSKIVDSDFVMQYEGHLKCQQ